jgi:hypothetical protein
MAGPCATYRRERSANGYPLDVLISGLQKGIRRGDEGLALRCAEELDGFAEAPGGERIRTNMFHRLQVSFLEDIGVGNYRLWPQLASWVRGLDAHRAGGRPLVRLLELIIRNLCRSRKTRLCSHMRAVAELGRRPLETVPAQLRQLWAAPAAEPD